MTELTTEVEGMVLLALAMDMVTDKVTPALAMDMVMMPVGDNSEAYHSQSEQYHKIEEFPDSSESRLQVAFPVTLEYTHQVGVVYHSAGLPVLA